MCGSMAERLLDQKFHSIVSLLDLGVQFLDLVLAVGVTPSPRSNNRSALTTSQLRQSWI